MAREIGSRVGAVLGTSDKDKRVVRFLGFGVYAGDDVPKDAFGWMAEALVQANVANPRIDLDSGKTVWGCECWWGPEERIKKQLQVWRDEGFEIVDVDIDDVRKEAAAKMAEKERE